MKEVMTTEDAAEVIGVHQATVRKWLRKGELTGCDTPAGWRITKADVEAWLNKYRREPKKAEPAGERPP